MPEHEGRRTRVARGGGDRPTVRAGRASDDVAPALDPVLACQRTLGNQAVQRLLGAGALPAVLALGRQPALGNFAVQRLLAARPARAEPRAEPPARVERTPYGMDDLVEDLTPADPELALGRRLWKEFPNGVAVVFYADFESAKNRAEVWAKGEDAVGPKGKTVSAGTLVFGQAIPDSLPLEGTLAALHKVLAAAAAKAAPAPQKGAAAGSPAVLGGPAKVRALALFAHGTPEVCGIAAGLTTGTAKAKVKAIAPTLADDVTVLLHACSNARQLNEFGRGDPERWVRGTMEGGGAGSLAGVVRDLLADAGKGKASVWGRTTTGYAVRNPAVRAFFVDPSRGGGKGVPGVSYAATFIFKPPLPETARAELEAKVAALGYAIGPPEAFRAKAAAAVTDQMYWCWAGAAKTITVKDKHGQERYLSETAARDPEKVAELVRDHWKQAFWTEKRQEATAKDLAKALRLKKTAK
jgi:hypothetical protein